MGISQEPGQVIETDPAFSGKSNRHNCFFPGNVDALDGGGCVTVDRSDSGSAAYLLCDLGQNSSPFYACVFVCRVEGCCDI